MVLKRSKLGGNTGNTLRKAGGYKVHPTLSAYISKTETDDFTHSTLFPFEEKKKWLKSGLPTKKNKQSLNTCKGVKYSLNKDKRWLLPDQLKVELEREQYLGEKFFSDEKEREKKRKKKRGAKHRPSVRERVAVTGQLCEWSDRLPYRNEWHTYINSAEPEHNRSSNSWRGPLNLPSDLPEIDVTYSIETPEGTSVVWPNYNTHRKFYKWEKEARGRWKGKENHFNDATVYEYVFKNNKTKRHIPRKEYDVVSGKELDVRPENHADADIQDFPPFSFRQNDLLDLDVFLKPNVKKQRKMCASDFDDETTKDVGKGHIIIIDHPEDFPVLTDITGLQGRNSTIQSLDEQGSSITQQVERPLTNTCANYCRGSRLRVVSSDISSYNLEKRFGERYIEAMCTPRRFAIFNQNFDSKDTLLTVHVLEENQDFSIVDLIVNHISNDFASCLQLIFDEEVLNFDFLADSCFSNDVKISCEEYIPLLFQKTCVEEVFKPIVMTTSINRVCRDLFTMDPVLSNDCDTIENCDEPNSDPTFCNICFSTCINTTSLNECKHSACDECWSTFSKTRVASLNSSRVPCIETACKQLLHPAAVITFLNPKLVSTYIKTYCEGHVLQATNLKFCGCPRCEAIAVSQNWNTSQDHIEIPGQTLMASNSAVVCRCNKNWCLTCGERDHWPSSCVANGRYLKKYNWKELFDGQGHLIKHSIKYKPCPKCRVPIIKNGGCDHMSCRCGSYFQWTYTQERVRDFTALDSYTGLSSFETRWQHRAIIYQSQYTNAKLSRTKLKVHKGLPKNSVRSLVSKALSTLASGFKLLENLSVATASCASRHKRGRMVKFINTFTFVLSLLETGLEERVGRENKMGKIKLDLDNVEKCLDDLVYIGVKRLK